MALVSVDELTEFMGLSLEKRKNRSVQFENLINEAEAYLKDACGIDFDKVSFSEVKLTPVNSWACSQYLYLKGDFFYTYEISEIKEGGLLLDDTDYFFNPKNAVIQKWSNFWNGSDILISGKRGFLAIGQNEELIKGLILERAAVRSRLWTRILSTTDGNVEGLILEYSDDHKNLIKRIKMRAC